MGVRLEKVILEVEDRATAPMLKFAGAVSTASAALHDLDGTSVGAARSGLAVSRSAVAVEKATDAASAAAKRHQDALGSLRVAEARLEAVRKSGNATLERLAAAEESVAKARRDVDLQATRSAVAARQMASANSGASDQVERLGLSSRRSGSDINQLTGRLAAFRDLAVTVGPGILPVAAVGIPAVTGLASALGFAAIGTGTLVAGFQGVFDTLDLLNKAQLDPTEANLEALHTSMQQLSPDARQMVREIDQLGPVLRELRDAAAGGMAPEVERAVDNLLEGLPRLRGLFEETANASADVLADGAGILTSERWQPFLNFLEREAPRAITSLGGSAGDLAHGFAEVFRALDPLNDDVLNVIERAARGFDRWGSGLKGSDGLEGFISYVRENGPLVEDAVTSIANAIVQIAQAAGPLGGPVLRAITGIAEAVAAVADSPFGTPFLTALSTITLINRGLKLTAGLSAAVGATSMLPGAGAVPGVVRGGPVVAGMTTAKPGRAAAVTSTVTTGLGAALIAPSIIESVQDLSGGYDGLSISVDDLASSLRKGKLPDELKNIGDSADTLKTRSESAFLSFSDGLNDIGGMPAERIQEARTELDALDQALGKISQTKGLGAAQKAFNSIAKSLDLSGSQKATLLDQLPQMGNKLTTFTGKVSGLSDETRALGRWLGGLDVNPKVGLDDDGFQKGKNRVDRGVDDLNALRGKARAELDDNPFFRTYSQVGGRIRDLDKQKANPTAGMNDNPFAQVYGKTRGQLQVLDAFTASPTAVLRDNASGPIAGIRSALASIDRTVTVTINTVRRGLSGFSFDTGGFTGVGGHLEPAGIVHRNEVVIPERYAMRDMGFLKARYPDLPGFAGGGVVGGAFSEIRGPVDHADSELGRNARDASDGLRSLKERIKDATKAVEEEKAARDRLRQSQQSYQSSITSSLMVDPFASGSSWSGTGGPLGSLLGTIADSKELRRDLRELRGNGVTGNALAQVDTLEEARQLAGISAAGQARYQRLYNRAQRQVRQTANYGGDAFNGEKLDAVVSQLDRANDRLHRLEKLQKQHGDRNHADHQESGTRTAKALNGTAKRARQRAGGRALT